MAKRQRKPKGFPAQLVQFSLHTPFFSSYPVQVWMFSCQPPAVARTHWSPGSSNQYTPWLQLRQETLHGKLNFTTNSFSKIHFFRLLQGNLYIPLILELWSWQYSKGYFFIRFAAAKKGSSKQMETAALHLWKSFHKVWIPCQTNGKTYFLYVKDKCRSVFYITSVQMLLMEKAGSHIRKKNYQPHSQVSERSKTIPLRQAGSTVSLINIIKHYCF